MSFAARYGWLSACANNARTRGAKVYSLHAPEVECIGKGKAHKPYEFGVKVSVATTLHRSKGGQFIVHAKALPGAPYDGHTLDVVIPEMEQMIGAPMQRVLADHGYRGHNAPPNRKFRVFIAGQKRRMTKAIKREMSAAPPSSRSSATPGPTTAWDGTSSPTPLATPPTPCSPPPATTSDACWPG